MQRTLETERLVLRPVVLRDFAFHSRLVSDPDVRAFLGGPVPWRDGVRRFWQLRKAGDVDTAWVACKRPGGQPLGVIELGSHKDGTDIELSYQFDPLVWGQGFAREAAACVVAFGLTERGLPKVIAETQVANVRSCRLLERLGFEEEKRVRRFGAEQAIYAITDI